MPPTAPMDLLHPFGEGDAAPDAALCSACRLVTVPNLTKELRDLPKWLESCFSLSNLRAMPHLPDARQLPGSAAKGCPLCRMILEAVLKWDQSESTVCAATRVERHSKRSAHVYESTWAPPREQEIAQFQEDLIDCPIYLRPSTSSRFQVDAMFLETTVPNPKCLHGFQVLVPVNYGVLTCQIALCALPGSSAAVSGDVIMRPALESSASPEAFSLIGRWLDACLSSHEWCTKTFCGASVDESSPPVLPSPIIHIGKSGDALCPRVVRAKGKRAHYVALSHCLGEVARQPALLETARTMLESDVVEIPWNHLPKAYQDAIFVSHRLGLDCIWIDTLCTPHEPAPDQPLESVQKGAIFESARLVIAATHATEFDHSLFPQRPDPPPTTRLQHISADGAPAGTLFASPKRQDGHLILPEFSPLASCAHATEQLLFARRLVCYSPHAITWACKRHSQRETGLFFHSTCRNPQWRVIVEKHSARSMASLDDRLGGIETLQREIGKSRPHDDYWFGLWRQNIPIHLLWFCVQPARRAENSLALPTWTWASALCPVQFAGRFSDPSRGLKSACKVTRLDKPTKTLVVRGAIRFIPRLAKWTDDVLWKHTATHDVLEPLNSLHASPPISQKRYLLGEDGAVIGWAFTDEPDVPCTPLRCMPVITKKVSAKKLARKLPLFRAWILLLPASEDDFGQFQRVGIGVISTNIPWFDDEVQTQIFLG